MRVCVTAILAAGLVLAASTARAQQAAPQVSPEPAPPAPAPTKLPELLVDTSAEKKKPAAKKKPKAKAPSSAQQSGAPPAATREGKTESALGPVEGYVATQSATGTKTGTPLIEVPQSVSVITADQIAARGVQEESEALLYTPGVFAQPYGSALNQYNPYYQIRGFSSAYGGTYADGLPAFANLRSESYGVERLEVMRGPSSVLYGQGDPGGIVNRIHKLPTEEAFSEVRFTFGTFGRLQPAFDFGGPVDEGGHVLYRVTGLGSFGDAPIEYDFGQEVPYERKYVAPSVTWRPDNQTTLTLRYEYLKDDSGQDTSLQLGRNLTHIRVDQPGADDFDYEHSTLGYSFEHKIAPGLSVRQNLSYVNLDYDIFTLYQGDPIANTSEVQRFNYSFDTVEHGIYVDTMVQMSLITGAAKHEILVGLDYQRTKDRTAFGGFEEVSPLDILAPDYSQPIPLPIDCCDDTTEQRVAGLYLQDQVKLFDQLVLTLGGRQDWFSANGTNNLDGSTSSQSGDAFTYRIGLNYLFPSGFTPYAHYSQSFLPTSGADFDGNLFVPTTGTEYEAGIKYRPAGLNANFTFAAFDVTKQNVVTRDPVAGHDNFNVQTGEVRNRGIELEATTQLTRDFSLLASYTYLNSEITKSNTESEQGMRLQLTPSHMASGWVEYKLPGGPLAGIVVNAGVRFIGENFADNANTFVNSAYTMVDAGARYDLGRALAELKGAEIALNATNLFNKEVQSCWGEFSCAWVTPRTVLGTLSYRW